MSQHVKNERKNFSFGGILLSYCFSGFVTWSCKLFSEHLPTIRWFAGSRICARGSGNEGIPRGLMPHLFHDNSSSIFTNFIYFLFQVSEALFRGNLQETPLRQVG